MKQLHALLAWLGGLFSGHEPAVVTAVLAAAINLAAHYQFHLSPTLQTYLAVVVTSLVHLIVRQSVVPVAKLPTVDEIEDSD